MNKLDGLDLDSILGILPTSNNTSKSSTQILSESIKSDESLEILGKNFHNTAKELRGKLENEGITFKPGLFDSKIMEDILEKSGVQLTEIPLDSLEKTNLTNQSNEKNRNKSFKL